jgi:DNA-binding FadR family transcriptional regulator
VRGHEVVKVEHEQECGKADTVEIRDTLRRNHAPESSRRGNFRRDGEKFAFDARAFHRRVSYESGNSFMASLASGVSRP